MIEGIFQKFIFLLFNVLNYIFKKNSVRWNFCHLSKFLIYLQEQEANLLGSL